MMRLVGKYPIKARVPGNIHHDRIVLRSGYIMDDLRAAWRRDCMEKLQRASSGVCRGDRVEICVESASVGAQLDKAVYHGLVHTWVPAQVTNVKVSSATRAQQPV